MKIEALEDKKIAVLSSSPSCCEENDIAVFDGIRIPYEKMTKYLRWHSIGEILIPGVGNTGEIVKTNGCEQAAQLVEQL